MNAIGSTPAFRNPFNTNRPSHPAPNSNSASLNGAATASKYYLSYYYYHPWGFSSQGAHWAFMTKRHQLRYGSTEEQLGAVSVAFRKHASMNPNAIMKERFTIEDYMNSRMISSPLCLFDCDIPIEGCTAVLLTTADRAKHLRQPPAYIAGYGQQAVKRPSLATYTVDDYMACGGSTVSKIWDMSGLGPKDIGAAQLYDGFSPSTYYWLEASGFCGEGEAWQFVQDGRIALNGELPVNTFGGSLSEGRLHGMGHLAEAVRQVTGRAGPRQIEGCEASIALDGSPMLRNAGILFTREP